MLFQYMRRAQRILRDQRVQMISPADLIAFVNEARGQIAGEAECVVATGALNITSASQVYPFSSLTFSNGIAGALNVRTMWYGVGSGQIWIRPRPWPWFALYHLNNAAPQPGPPKIWSQYGQGVDGTFYLSPVPDQNYTLSVDSICYPAELKTDADPEVIPYLWTDAIAYYALYLGLLAMQTGGSTAESDKMYQRYEQYVARARRAATPPVLPSIYAQQPNLVRAGQLGMTAQSRGGQ